MIMADYPPDATYHVQNQYHYQSSDFDTATSIAQYYPTQSNNSSYIDSSSRNWLDSNNQLSESSFYYPHVDSTYPASAYAAEDCYPVLPQPPVPCLGSGTSTNNLLIQPGVSSSSQPQHFSHHYPTSSPQPVIFSPGVATPSPSQPSKAMTRKHSRSNTVSENQRINRLEARRKRNREAAQRCRTNRIETINRLERERDQLQSEIESLSDLMAKYDPQVEQLDSELVASHRRCYLTRVSVLSRQNIKAESS